jgi:hypothetical protein
MKRERGRPLGSKSKKSLIKRWEGALRNGASKGSKNTLLHRMRKHYEKPDSGTLLMTEKDFYNPDRPRLPELLGIKVRIARRGSPPPGYYPSPEEERQSAERDRQWDETLREMAAETARTAEEACAIVRAEWIDRWLARVDEAMRMRKERRHAKMKRED